MLIERSRDQEKQLLEWAGRWTRAELEADCEPSGYDLVVSIGEPWGAEAVARHGTSVLELGEVVVTLGGSGTSK